MSSIVIAVLLALFQKSETAANAGRPATVCEVLSDLQKYDGKVIEIRAPWRGGNLSGDCPGQQTGDWVWPDAIAMVLPTDPTLKRPVSWTFSKSDYEEARREADRLVSNERGIMAVATVVGRLDVHNPEDYPPGTNIIYGKLNSFHAHLVVQIIKDISTEKIIPINPETALTVCEALENRDKYNGKFIQIRDRFFGNSLRGVNCPVMRTATYTWDTVIALTLPGDAALAQLPAWNVDYVWYDDVISNSIRLLQPPDKTFMVNRTYILEPIYPNFDPPVFATVLGRFDSGDLELYGARTGYGHLDSLPAQLVVADVKDVSKAPKP